MISTRQIVIKKKLPFDAKYVEEEFEKQNLNVLRWAVVEVSDDNFVIDAAIEDWGNIGLFIISHSEPLGEESVERQRKQIFRFAQYDSECWNLKVSVIARKSLIFVAIHCLLIYWNLK